MVIVLLSVASSPETYLSFARAYYYGKVGPKPNFVTEYLQKQGYTEGDLKKVAKLVHMPVLSYTPEERAFIEKVRLSLPKPEVGFKVITDENYKNYVSGEWKPQIGGFWGDARFYGGQSRETFIYDQLRLDYEGTKHFASNSSKTYAIQFDPKIGKTDIPFDFDVNIEAAKVGDLQNLPSNPFSGSGFTTARDGSLIPEYEYPEQVFYDLNKGAKLGYFDEKGNFIPEYECDGQKWKKIK